jgi:DNA adenine methylase
MTEAAVADEDWLSLQPFARWVGGKRWLAPRLSEEIIATKPRLYVEPFLGGGAVALSMPRSTPKVLSDINPHLVDVWLCIKRQPALLLSELAETEQRYGNDQEGYLLAREAFNFMARSPRAMWVQRSAVFLYLNARCFNGLWRTNQKGLFNVPFGKLAKPKQLDDDDIMPISGALKNADLRCQQFPVVLHQVFAAHSRCYRGRGKSSLDKIAIYADSPYIGTFDSYDKDGFTEEDHQGLADLLRYAVARGASIWASNSDTPFTRELYSWAHIEEVGERHSVGPTGAQRGNKSCLLIRGGGACR